MKRDLSIWLEFLNSYNGASFFIKEQWVEAEKLHLYTDAAKSLGYGLIMGKKWVTGKWGQEAVDLSISALEMYPILLALLLFSSELKGKSLVIHTDNEALVHVFNNKSSKDPYISNMLRELTLVCLRHNLRVRAVHIPGHFNSFADALSRLQVSKFKGNGTMGRTGSSVCPPTIPATQLAEDLTNILKSALATSTLQSYKRSWLVYRSYLGEVMLEQVISLPQDPITSIASYMSAIGYAHKSASVSDPTQSAIVQKAVMSLKSKGHSLDTRSPITLSVLQTLIDPLSSASFPNFDKALMQAVAFYGLFRIGELLATTGGAAQFRVIQLRDVRFSVKGMVIVVSNYKHNHRGVTPLGSHVSSTG